MFPRSSRCVEDQPGILNESLGLLTQTSTSTTKTGLYFLHSLNFKFKPQHYGTIIQVFKAGTWYKFYCSALLYCTIHPKAFRDGRPAFFDYRALCRFNNNQPDMVAKRKR